MGKYPNKRPIVPRQNYTYLVGPRLRNWGGAGAMLVGAVYLSSINIPTELVVDGIIYDMIAWAGNIRMGIYRSGPDGLPDGEPLVYETPAIAPVLTGVQLYDIPEVVLIPGKYWTGIMGDNAADTYSRAAGVSNTEWGRQFANSIGFGVFDDPCPVTAPMVVPPLLGLRVIRVHG